MGKAKQLLAVLAIASVASLGVVGPSSAAVDHTATEDDPGFVLLRIGDPWCC